MDYGKGYYADQNPFAIAILAARTILEEVRLIFENELNILTKNIKIMGLEEQILHMVREDGIEEGKKEGLREGKLKLKEDLLKNLIFKLGYTDKAAAEVIQVSVNFVKKPRKQNLLNPLS